MRDSASSRAVTVAAVYLAAGLVFGALSARSSSAMARIGWRRAAWMVSAVAFTIHVLVEARRGARPRAAAWHAAAAAALGAFGLAAAANVHAWQSSTHPSLLLVLSLVIWPAMTLLPALVVAFAIAHLHLRMHPRH